MRPSSLIQDSSGATAATAARPPERAVIDAALAVNRAGTLDEALAIFAEAGLKLAGAAGAAISVQDGQLEEGIVRASAGEPDVGSLGYRITVPLAFAGFSGITFEAGWPEPVDEAVLERANELLTTLGRLTSIAMRAARERDRATDQASLDATIEAVADGVLIVRGREVQMNAAARRILAVGTSSPPSLPSLNLRTLEGRALSLDELPHHVALATGEVQRFRYRLTNLAGSDLVVDGTISPFDGGRGLVVLFRDVTSDHLREFLNEQYLRTLFDAIPTAILLVDPASRGVVSGNRAFRELVGYELEDVIGRRPPYPWWAASTEDWVEPDANGQANYERLYRRSDGRLVPVQISSQLIRDQEERPLSQLALITDLSGRRRMEQQLVQSGKLAAIGELAAGVAHEINNPLFAILGLVEFLVKDAEPGSKTHDRLTLVQQTGLEIKEIVRSLLDFARESSEERHLVSLEVVVAQTVDLIRRTSASKGIELVERYESGDALVSATPNQIKQIFLNLLGNARQAMPEGGTITIEVRREGDGVLALVSDTGPGIAEGLETRIFEPFFTTKRDSGGTGLGLSVSLGIAEAHGGSLTVDSSAERGAAFTLRLPLAREAA